MPGNPPRAAQRIEPPIPQTSDTDPPLIAAAASLQGEQLEKFLRWAWDGFKNYAKRRAAENRRSRERVVLRRESTYWDQVLGNGPAGRDDD